MSGSSWMAPQQRDLAMKRKLLQRVAGEMDLPRDLVALCMSRLEAGTREYGAFQWQELAKAELLEYLAEEIADCVNYPVLMALRSEETAHSREILRLAGQMWRAYQRHRKALLKRR